MNTRCPQCGAEIEAGKPCPRCLLHLALASAGESDSTTAATGGLGTPRPQAAPLPENFGAYHPIGVLGEGGMGIVYLAEQEQPIRRRVALKVIKLGMDTHNVVARFESERQALALMDHPNIAQVYDAGTTPEGRPYFAMEYVPGIPITDYCDRHLLGLRQRLDLFIQVCQAIHHAHQKGVIHRDIKPSNVLVMIQDGKPVPKVIDFGVAKATNQRLTEKTVFTEIGVLIGTPAYMSPEQAEMTGLDVDTATDIYSLGVLLYELLVGALPFDPQALRKAGHDEIRRIIREEEPPRPTARLHTMGATASEVARRRHTDVRTLARFLRGDLDWITMKALEKDRTCRYASASEFGADVVRHLHDEPVHAGPPGAVYRARKFVRKHRTGVAAVAALLLVSLAGAVVSTAMFFRAERDKREAQRQSYISNIHAADLHLRSIEAEAARRQLLLGDPKLRGWEWRHLWFQADSSLATLNVDDDFGRYPYFTSIVFSRNNGRVYWNTQFTLHAWDSSTYEAAAKYGGFGEILALSQGGERILAKRDRTLRLIEPATGAILAQFQIDATHLESAALSPDGRRAATSLSNGQLQLWDLPSAREIMSFPGGPAQRGLVFSPDGLRIATAGLEGLRVWEPVSGRCIFKTENVRVESRPIFSPDGASLAAGSMNGLFVWDVKFGRVKLNAPSADRVEAVAFSPDATLIALAAYDQSVRILDAVSGATLAMLVGNSFGNPSAAAFSPDGERLFVATEVGQVHVWDARTFGGTSLRRMEADISAAAVSPDGARLAIGLDNGTVCLLDAASGKSLAKWNTTALGMNAGQKTAIEALTFSPDGSRIALGGSNGIIGLRDVRSGRELADLSGHTAGIASVSFDPAGAYLASGSLDSSVRVWSLSSGAVVAKLVMKDPVNSAVFSPDGDRILIAAGDTHSIPANDVPVQLWEWRKDQPPMKLNGGEFSEAPATAAVFSPDGREIAAVRSAYPEVVFWNTSSWKWTKAESIDDMFLWKIAFSPDSSRFVTESFKGATRVWDARTHERLLSLETGGNSAHLAAFSPDSSILYTAAGDRIRIWDTRSGYPAGLHDLLGSMQGQLDLPGDVMDRLRADRKLDLGLREAALRYWRAYDGWARDRNDAAWKVVKEPNRPPQDYRKALRAAEAVVKDTPWKPGYHHTLGMAQYRCGQFREALVSLERDPSFPGGIDPLFAAMAYFKLGEVEKARARLKIVQDRKRNGASIPAERLAFLQEAERLIEGPNAKR